MLDHTDLRTPRRAPQVSLIAAYMQTAAKVMTIDFLSEQNKETDDKQRAHGFMHFLLKYLII